MYRNNLLMMENFLFQTCTGYFDVLLTVNFSIFILVINQLDAQNLFFSKFISCLYVFRAPCARNTYKHEKTY